jgi:integrase/recombinase XerD
MTLSELVAQYVSHKRALGMRFDSEAATLASFVSAKFPTHGVRG